MKTKNVCVIGLGYVGLPMAIALANVKKNKTFMYKVFGYDNDKKKLNHLNKSIKLNKLPFYSPDEKLKKKFKHSSKNNKINIVKNISQINESDIIVLSVGFDFVGNKNSYKNIISLIKKISKFIKKNTLLLIETTLPPGTFEKILIPQIKITLKKRRMKLKDIYLSYSYERIMPGKKYYDSIINNNRCYSGFDKASKNKTKNFLKSFINYKNFPLQELNTITECEAAKILENSYRAINIALIDEWVNYSDIIKIDLFNVIKSIKVRPTHSNMMVPGLGVGGYCLPKDGLFASKSSEKIFKRKIKFPFIDLASKVNDKMPFSSIKFIEKNVKNLKKKKILVLGSAYKDNVDDERNSPSKILIKSLINKGSELTIYDPMLKKEKLPNFNKYNLILFCVNHDKFKKIPIKKFSKKPLYFDLNNVIDEKKIEFMKKNFFKLFILGRYYG